MNASIVVVIVGQETNISLSWTKRFPPVLLTDEITVSNDQTHKCNNFGRIAVRGTRRRRNYLTRAEQVLGWPTVAKRSVKCARRRRRLTASMRTLY